MKSPVTGFAVYKPTKSLKGSVIQFNPMSDYSCVFLEIAPQNGDNTFDFETKIVMKMGQTDILQILDILELVRTAQYKELLRRAPEELDQWMASLAVKDNSLVNLFHMDKKKNSSSVLNIKPNSSKYGGGFLLHVSKKTEDAKPLSYQIGINPSEALGIIYCLEKCLFNRV